LCHAVIHCIIVVLTWELLHRARCFYRILACLDISGQCMIYVHYT